MVQRITDDIKENTKFPKYVDRTDATKVNLVEIEHIVKYFALGVMYDNLTEDCRRVFKEKDLEPTEKLMKIMSDIEDIATKKETNLDDEAVLYFKSKEKKVSDNQKGKVVHQQASGSKEKSNAGQQ